MLWNGLELPESYFHDDSVYIVHGDCLEVLPQIPSNSIDSVLCDLPYGVTARNKWDNKLPLTFLWREWWRLGKIGTPIVLTATEPFSSELVSSQIRNFRYDLIWSKPMATGFLNANRMPLRSHEQILVFYRKLPTYNPQKIDGKPYKMTRRGDSTNYNEVSKLHWETNSDGKRFPKSVIQFAWDKLKLHPTQKPVSLFEYLIKTYTNDNDIVLDNCLGSGTTLLASKQTNRKCIGIEISEEYCELATIRYLRNLNV